MREGKILYEINTGELTDRDRAIDNTPDAYKVVEESTGCGIIIKGIYGGSDDPLFIYNPGPRWLVKHLLKRIAELEEIERRWKNGEAYLGE